MQLPSDLNSSATLQLQKSYFSFAFVKSHKPEQSNSQLSASQELKKFSGALASAVSGWQKEAPIHGELPLVNYQHVQGL